MMRLSDAIRKGCTRYPVQGFLAMGYGEKACALGAAVAGLGYDPRTAVAQDHFTLLSEWCECPMHDEGCGRASVADTIIVLNDMHRWTREAIADWVESIEMGEMSQGETHDQVYHLQS